MGIMKVGGKNLPWVIVLTLLLGHWLETLPDFHHAEQSHRCMRHEGSFYYVETAPPLECLQTQPVLRGIHLDEGHQHHACAFCQMAAWSFPPAAKSYGRAPERSLHRGSVSTHAGGFLVHQPPARAPPYHS